MRVAQEAASRDLATVRSQFQSLEIGPLRQEVERLGRRAEATDSVLTAAQSRLDTLAPQTGAAAPTARPGTSPVPAPLPPDPAVMRAVPAPTPPAPAVASPVPAPVPPAPSSMTPPSPATPPAASAPAPAAPEVPVERPRTARPPSPSGLAPAGPDAPAPAPNVARATPPPQAALAPPPGAAPPKSAPKAGNAEQEYAAALATFRAREHGQAVLDFIDFLAKYPKHSLAGNAQYWIGEAYWAQRDYRQALVEFDKVFEHGPAKAPDAMLKVGLCHLRLSDVPRAQQAWQRVVNEYPKSESAAMARSLLATHSSARR